MKRRKVVNKSKADAILTGDWHLQDKQPIARTDDFWETQWNKLDFISELQKKHKCPVIHSGDLFDHWKPSPELLSKAIEHLPDSFFTVYGNHDLPQHNLELAHKCGIYLLEKAGSLSVLEGTHWNNKTPVPIGPDRVFKRKMAVWHTMTYTGRKPWPGCTDPRAAKLLKKYSEFDLIVTGHNHIPFVEYYEGRCLVNPGSIFRLTASQKDFKPRVYLWYSETNTVTPVFLPIEENVITDEHITSVKERDERIDTFINQLDTDVSVNLSFEDKLEQVKQQNNISDSIFSIIYKAMNI